LLDFVANFSLKQLLTPLVLLWLLVFLQLWRSYRQQQKLPRLSLLLWLCFSASSCKPLIDQLALPLEQSYPAFNQPQLQHKIQHILVLGCSHSNQSALPLTSQLAPCSLARISEGIRLWRQQPTAQLHFSGHLPATQQQHSEIARQFAVAMGVPAGQIVLHPAPGNTRQEAQALTQAIGQDKAVVVTSAMHLPRAMRWFAYYGRHKGDHLYAAPTQHSTASREPAPYQLKDWLPSLMALEALYYLQYEYVALLQQQWQLQTEEPPAAASD
jgi:uncharacterized SAM-binding protein YcdF (DUF218 family)